ncbi:MAG: lipid-binding SYLF domain-containing protein [Woeseia sp.]
MHIRLRCCLLVLSIMVAMPAAAATKEEKRVADATDVLDQLLRIPEQSVPPALLARAYAVAVVPNVVKLGFGLGARRGKGILVVRREDNSWSNPAFIALTGGSFGWQIGAQSTDIILVFKTREGVEGITNGKLTLGADASIAAGPVGRHTEIATDIQFKSEVFSYSRSRGIFLGVALEGAGVTMDRVANAAFYGSSSITPAQIFASSGNSAPAVANTFVQVLTAQTRRLPKQPGMGSGISSAGTREERKSSVRTFGLRDPEEPVAESGEQNKDF